MAEPDVAEHAASRGRPGLSRGPAPSGIRPGEESDERRGDCEFEHRGGGPRQVRLPLGVCEHKGRAAEKGGCPDDQRVDWSATWRNGGRLPTREGEESGRDRDQTKQAGDEDFYRRGAEGRLAK